jgi:hypothetical protein
MRPKIHLRCDVGGLGRLALAPRLVQHRELEEQELLVGLRERC